MKRVGALCAALCALAIACAEARATTAVAVTPEEQVAEARAICLGRCTHIESRNIGGEIFTYITLDVREVLKGPVTTGELVIKQTGGAVGDLGEWIDGSPRFDVGRDSLVFLSTNGEGALVVAGLFMGNFYVEQGRDGREWIVRDGGGEGSRVLGRPGAASEQLLDRMPIDDLRAVVAREARQSRPQPVDAIYQVPPEYHQPFEGPSEATPSFVLMDNARWFEPDTGDVVPFSCNPTNFAPGSVIPDLQAAVVDALAAWSSIDGCSFKYQYAGVNTSTCGWGPRDGVSLVSVDCRFEITGSGCFSIIAIGGGHYDRGHSVTVNGISFSRIFEADVCLQDGVCDYFRSPVALREVLTHELGHCLGLAHSADPTANMAPFIHNDGRGTTLQPDDMDGARFIYPIGIVDAGPPAIATDSLPEANRGAPYTATLSAAKGKAPLTWSCPTNDLPPGLTLSSDGVLAGTPASAGSYTFTLRVADASDRSDDRPLSLDVRVPPPVIASAAYVQAKKQLTIEGSNFAADAEFELNGVLVVPRKPPVFDAATGTFVVKGSRKQLHLNKGAGANQLVLIVDGARSQAFVF